MKSLHLHVPELIITPCDSPPSSWNPKPALRRRYVAQRSAYLATPNRAETRTDRLELARKGLATGSFRMNCLETPFLVDEDGFNFFERLQMNGPYVEILGTMERPLSTTPTLEYEAHYSRPPQSTPPVVPLFRNGHPSRARSRSLDISWPRKLGHTVITQVDRKEPSGGMTRSATITTHLSDLCATASLDHHSRSIEKQRTPRMSFQTLQASASTLRRKMVESLWPRGVENNPSPSPIKQTVKLRPRGTIQYHSRAQSLDIAPADRPRMSTSKSVHANINLLARDSLPIPVSPNDLPKGTISKSLHAKASNLRKKVLGPWNKHM